MAGAMKKICYWLKASRAPLLSVSLVVIFLGTCVAVAEGMFHLWRCILAMVGLVLFQASLHLLDEYSDFRTGIDFYTSPTPFSGGSGMLTSGTLSAPAVYASGIVCLITAISIGLIFVFLTDISLFPIVLVGAFAVYSYNDFFQRKMLGEVIAGLGLGLLPVMGASFIQTESFSTSALVAGISAGLLTFNLLLLCEFPDYAADTRGGRRNLVIVFGKETAGKLYTILMGATYLWIVVSVVFEWIPKYCLVALLTLPVAWKPMLWSWMHVHEEGAIVSVLGANLTTNLATQTLLGVGFLASACL
jgi:1,4-dihydroxy-2-naphthoate polyprenyltransferase